MSIRRVLAGLALALAAAACRSVSPNAVELQDFPLEGVRRLLVLASHCDDETLGCAGLIQQALQQGAQVRVVLATNGDGFLFATMEEFRRVYPRREDFVRMGLVRQRESLAALDLLGVARELVSFLGYPDRGSPKLWNEYWSPAGPYRSWYSRYDRSPYELTYNPRSVYSGEDYLSDLRSMLVDFRPDLIVLPHPNDMHPDHWGLSLFGRLALALLRHELPDYQPEVYAYLVHRYDFPEPKGLLPEARLAPPRALRDMDPRVRWLRLELSPEEVQKKQEAVFAYRTQFPLMRGLLESFVRRNELFEPVLILPLPCLAAGKPLEPGGWRNEDGRAVEPVPPDPVQDGLVRTLIAGVDLTEVYAGLRPDGSLAVCARLRGPALPQMSYVLWVVAADPQGMKRWTVSSTRQPGVMRLRVKGACFGFELSAAELGRPRYVLVEAEVLQIGIGTLDRSAWCLLSWELSAADGPGSAP